VKKASYTQEAVFEFHFSPIGPEQDPSISVGIAGVWSVLIFLMLELLSSVGCFLWGNFANNRHISKIGEL